MRHFYEILEADYEKWLKRTSPPHPYGPDRSDLDLDHDYEQFQVLTPAGADAAWKALLRAEQKASDPKVKERVALVKSVFSFVRPCVHEYWTLASLRSAKDASEAVKQARRALALAREKAEIKEQVMEGPAVKPWTMIFRQPYDQIHRGVIPVEVHMAIDEGFESARRSRPNENKVWEQLSNDPDPVIAQSARAVLLQESLETNLVADPGFEGTQLPELIDEATRKGSVRFSTVDPHSGRQCAMLFDCKNSSLIQKVRAGPGEKLRVSVWLRAEEYHGGRNIPGLYGVRVNFKQGKNLLNTIRVPAELDKNWQQTAFPVTTPAGTDVIEVLVTAQRQHANAGLYADDWVIKRVPVPALKMSGAQPQTGPTIGPPE